MSTSLGKHVTLTKPDDFGKLLEDEGIIFTTLDKAVNWARKARSGLLVSALLAAPSK